MLAFDLSYPFAAPPRARPAARRGPDSGEQGDAVCWSRTHQVGGQRVIVGQPRPVHCEYGRRRCLEQHLRARERPLERTGAQRLLDVAMDRPEGESGVKDDGFASNAAQSAKAGRRMRPRQRSALKTAGWVAARKSSSVVTNLLGASTCGK